MTATGTLSINTNFVADWERIMRADIVQRGYADNPSDDVDAVSIKFFNVRRRLISRRPRRVHEPSGFAVPATLAAGYALLKAAFESGADINPHVSRQYIKKADFHDGLLNDWAVFHFHLGTTFLPNGLVAGTDPILFAQVYLDDVFCIGFFHHGQWSELDIIRILRDNWPEVLEPHHQKLIVDTENTYTVEQYQELRDAHISTLLNVDGKVYSPMGGGYTSSGASMHVARLMIRYKQLLSQWERWLRETPDLALPQLPPVPNNVLNLTLELDAVNFIARDTNSKIAVVLGPHGLDDPALP